MNASLNLALEAVMNIAERARQCLAADPPERRDLVRGALLIGLVRGQVAAGNVAAARRHLQELDAIFARRLAEDRPENAHHDAIEQDARLASAVLDAQDSAEMKRAALVS